jgi:beta-glucanase (GH16 family)
MALRIPVNLSGGKHSRLADSATTPQDRLKSENPSVLDYGVPTQGEIDYLEAKGIESTWLKLLWERAQLTLDSPLVPKGSDVDRNSPDPGASNNQDVTGSISTPSSAFFDLWSQPLWQRNDTWDGPPGNLSGYRLSTEPTWLAVEKPQVNGLEYLTPGSLPLELSNTGATNGAIGLGGAGSNGPTSPANSDRPGTLTVDHSAGDFVTGTTVTTHLTDPDGVGAAIYHWSSMGSDGKWHAISGATAAAYTLTDNDVGKLINVVATYTDGKGHHDAAAVSFGVSAPSTIPPDANGATLLWSAEFDTPLDMKSASNPGGLWMPVDFWQNINSGGYEDFAGTSWNINPNNPIFAPYNPFSVQNGYLQIEASRVPTELVAPIQSEMQKQGQPGGVPEWMGGMLITNKDEVTFTYGYFEFRERIPEGDKGIFPAMWFYSAHESADPQGKATAEIDLLEIFGDPNRWHINIHGASSFEAGSQTADTSGWHTYGMLWEPDLLQFYRDGHLLYTVTGPQASYFNDLELAIRVNFSMDAPWFPPSSQSDGSTQSMQMQIDYIRQYSELPYQTGTG